MTEIRDLTVSTAPTQSSRDSNTISIQIILLQGNRLQGSFKDHYRDHD